MIDCGLLRHSAEGKAQSGKKEGAKVGRKSEFGRRKWKKKKLRRWERVEGVKDRRWEKEWIDCGFRNNIHP